jgi:hypothetical protein
LLTVNYIGEIEETAMNRVYTVPTDVAEKSHGKFKRSATLRQIRESPARAAVGPKEHYQGVAEAAYFRAEHRGFLPGHELQDWLDAEAELDKPPTQVS